MDRLDKLQANHNRIGSQAYLADLPTNDKQRYKPYGRPDESP